MSSSISRRLVFWLAVPLMLLALCGALVHYINRVAPDVISSDRRLREAASALIARVRSKNGAIFVETEANDVPPLPDSNSILYAIRDPQGHLLAGNESLAPVILHRDTQQLTGMTTVNHRAVRTSTTRYETQYGAALVTTVDLRSGAEPAARYGFMSTLLWDFLQLDATLLLVWLGIRIGLRPVENLRQEIASRSPQDLRSIDERTVPQEIAPLVATLNRLFSTLRSSAQSQQQFIANTAHQLRTPITGLQAQLDLLAAEPAAHAMKERLPVLQQGIRQLAHSANQLLTLARVDPGVNIAAKRQTVQLHATVEEVAARFFDRALERGIDLGIEVEPASINADPSLLDDLLSNLVDNAIKYTPIGGSVTISVGHIQNRPFLAVADTGPGIPESERQRVRQRFYRIPNSPGHGSGLGLAIVDEVAHLYGASVLIAGSGEAPSSGTRVEVLFPA